MATDSFRDFVADPIEHTLTLAAWAALPEDTDGEWFDGVLVEEEVASLLHEAILGKLYLWFLLWMANRGGHVILSSVKYRVSSGRGRKPDLSVFFPGGPVLPRQGLLTIPPDVAVEIVSPALSDQKRDRVEKRHEYAAFGVRYYWLVDPQLRTLEVLELGADGRYVFALSAESGPVLEVPGCPGLTFNLDELWAEIDRLGAETPEETLLSTQGGRTF